MLCVEMCPQTQSLFLLLGTQMETCWSTLVDTYCYISSWCLGALTEAHWGASHCHYIRLNYTLLPDVDCVPWMSLIISGRVQLHLDCELQMSGCDSVEHTSPQSPPGNESKQPVCNSTGKDEESNTWERRQTEVGSTGLTGSRHHSTTTAGEIRRLQWRITIH